MTYRVAPQSVRISRGTNAPRNPRRARVTPRSASDTPTTVPPPAILTDTRACAAHVRAGFRRASAKPRVRPITVIVLLEFEELHLQVSDRPEERAVETFAPNRSNQPFDEWMRERYVRHRLDFLHVEYPQIR